MRMFEFCHGSVIGRVVIVSIQLLSPGQSDSESEAHPGEVKSIDLQRCCLYDSHNA